MCTPFLQIEDFLLKFFFTNKSERESKGTPGKNGMGGNRMAEKDITEKILMRHADVFADCINVLSYGGKIRLKQDFLQPAPTESFYRSRKGVRNQFCDVSFYLVEGGKIKAQYIIENETRIKRRQVLRKFSYEGGAYREQTEARGRLYPVISMVIDWSRKRTYIPLSLHALLAADGAGKEELALAEDIRLTVHHMRNLSREVRSQFTSDIGFVADFLNEGSFENRKGQKIVHSEALCEMMEALTGDDRFTEQMNQLLKEKEKGDVTMCEYIDMLEARGEVRGEMKGERKLLTLLAKLYAMGRDEDARLIVRDENARKRLYEEFCITNS